MKNHAYKCYLSLEITILANEEREREREGVCLCVMIPVVGAKVCKTLKHRVRGSGQGRGEKG